MQYKTWSNVLNSESRVSFIEFPKHYFKTYSDPFNRLH